MKKSLLITFLGLTSATASLQAQMTQNLALSGPTTWTPGASVVLALQDTFSGYGGGSYGFSYWLEVNTAVAPFLTITGITSYPPSLQITGHTQSCLTPCRRILTLEKQ